MSKHRRLRIAHLTLHRKLSLDVDLTTPTSNKEDYDSRKNESRSEDDDGTELDYHHDRELSDPAEVLCDWTIDGADVLRTASDDSGYRSCVEPPGDLE